MGNDLSLAIAECARWGIAVQLFSRDCGKYPSDFGVKYYGVDPDAVAARGLAFVQRVKHEEDL